MLMSRTHNLVWAGAFALAGLFIQIAYAGNPQLPGTLNFTNVTNTNINQTVAEQASNEKEVEFGDFDNDDDLDVLVAVGHSDFGTRRNKLYRNDNGVYNEISTSVPLFSTADVARNGFFRDYNLDGFLDMIVVCDNNTGGDGGRTKLWINVNDGVNHIGWSEEGNSRLGSSTGGAACSGVSIDADGNGGFDLYVGNYPGPSQDTMYTNDLTANFTDVTGPDVPSDSDYTVDVAAGDLNGDGKTDLVVASWDFDYIYYNDKNNAGSHVGDYNYAGSKQTLWSNTQMSENAIEPGDFDGDGRLDLYHSDYSASQDRIWKNAGNNAANSVVWSTSATFVAPLPTSTAVTTRKATVSDLNDDGRVDIFVMAEASRPIVLRNTTIVAHPISFVDWTPASVWPTGSTHRGWHAAASDVTGDDRPDIFLGGWTNDHLFHQVPGDEYLEADLTAGEIPTMHDSNPAAVLGSVIGQDYILEALSRDGGTPQAPGAAFVSGDAMVDIYTVNGIPAGASFNVILNSESDYMLEVLNLNEAVLGSSDRGGLGIEEVVSVVAPGGRLGLRVTLIEPAELLCKGHTPCADADGNGIRDDVCTWWECVASECLGTPIDFADIGGENGACPPDGAVDGNDRFHALNCFSNQNTTGDGLYACEPNAPTATNADAGGEFGSCSADGVCDAHDAFHALNVFEGNSNCSCAPAPDGGFEPDIVDGANLLAVARTDKVKPGSTLSVDVYLDGDLDDLRGYQLHAETLGGRSGSLELVDINVERREDAAFNKGAWRAFNADTAQMTAGLDSAGVPVGSNAYLATFTYRVSPDAAGTFTINMLRGVDGGRSFLIPTTVDSKIAIDGTIPATVTVSRRGTRVR